MWNRPIRSPMRRKVSMVSAHVRLIASWASRWAAVRSSSVQCFVNVGSFLSRISQIGSPSVYVRGPNSLNDDLRTASRGRLPGLTSFKARSYPRDSAGSADRVLFWAHVVCQGSRRSRLLSPAGSTSRCRPWPQVVDHLQDAAEQITRYRHLGHLEDRVAGVRDDLRADLDHLLAKRGQRPAFDLIWQSQRAQEVGQVAGQRMKLKADRVGLH